MREQRVSELCEPALRHLGIRRGVREAQLRAAFAVVVGPQLSALCETVSLERGILCIATAHGALAQQLQLDSPALIAALNARVGAATVRRLRFVPRG